MENRTGLLLLTAVAIASGCTSPGTAGSGEGNFELLISDAPAAIDDFESLNVSFSEARIFRSVNGSENYTVMELNDSTVDLTTVKGERAQPLANISMEAGEYSKIELYSSGIDAEVDGEDVDVKIPPGKLMITSPFTVSPNSTTSFVFDIQVVLRGNAQNNQGYILKPVISESGVAGEDVQVERSGPGRERKDGVNESSEDQGQPPEQAGR